MEKIAVNNLVLTLRNMLKAERFIVYRKMKGQRIRLENYKGPEAEKKKQKAKRLREQASYLMKADLKGIAVQAFVAEEPWQNVLVRSDSTDHERVEARLIGRPRVQEVITEFRSVNPDWKEWVPKLLEEWEERKEKHKPWMKVEIPVVSGVSEEPATENATAPKPQVKEDLIPGDDKTHSSAVKPPLQKKLTTITSALASPKPPLKKEVTAGSSTTTPTDDAKPLIKKEVVPAGSKAPPRDTLQPQVMKKILHGAGETKPKARGQLSKEGKPSGIQPKSLPVQRQGSMQGAVTGAAEAKKAEKALHSIEAEEELPPRKFAAGDPFFWPCERTAGDDGAESNGRGRAPSSSPMKQQLPPSQDGPLPRRSFAKSTAPPFKRQHSMAFGPGTDNRGRSQGFKKTRISTDKHTRDTPQVILEDSDLHPSWAAKRQAQKAMVPFQGKKVIFS